MTLTASRRSLYLAIGAVLLLGLTAGLLFLRSPARRRVIVLGMDGMDPRTIDLLMSEGKLANFARLRQGGAYGRLESTKPLLSPIIWTTIATGKTPDQHGIGHFVMDSENPDDKTPVSSEMRKVKAVWNVLSDQGRRVGVVGWWATWPAENINGFIVSDHTCYHFLFPEGAGEAKDPRGITYPPDLAKRIAPLIRRPFDVTVEEARRYADVGPNDFATEFTFKDPVAHFRWALATADSYRRIGLQLWKEEKPDVLLTYTEATDSMAHLFGHLFRAHGLSGELAEQQRKFGMVVEHMYELADTIVGDYLAAMDSDTALVVLSDHGFDLGTIQDDPSKTRDMRRVSERFHNMEGILYLYGAGIRQGTLDRPKILDVAPTILALAGVAPARDMPGRVLVEAIRGTVPATRVATYETAAGPRAAGAAGSNVDHDILERLKSLGYIGDGPPPSAAPSGAPRSRTGERNIAAVHFEAGRYKEAEEAYRELIGEKPDDASLHTSLAGVLGAQGKYDEALGHLEKSIKLEPLNTEAYHNRAVIYERKGRKDLAVEQYRVAVRYDPQYEPSRRALVRLTGSDDVDPPRTEAERRARALAFEAADMGRRGDYAGAASRLEEAEKIAPRYALVWQYRSNIAYLKGDIPDAIHSLQKALEAQPDNALYRTNLERLRKRLAGGGPSAPHRGASPAP